MKTRTLLPLALLLSRSQADGTYRTRPDLSPLHLNITIPCAAEACEKGYLFVAPFTTYGEADDRASFQAAPYILADTGDLVWSGFGYYAGWVGNLQAARWQGRDVLFSFEGVHNGNHGHGHGRHTLLGAHYDVLRVLRAGGNLISDKHEFIIVDEKTALVQIYHPLQRDLGAYGGETDQNWIVDARFQELDIATGRVLFEWHSLDHVSPNETALPLASGLAGVGRSSATAWDYFHINSLAKSADGHYLVSARHASTIYKINSTDGSVIWRLGGSDSDFALGTDVRFGFQHHARYLAEEPGRDVITLFDNSVYGSESAGDGHEIRIHPYSRGKRLVLDHAARTATLDQALLPPAVLGHGGEPILARSQGSLQTLPNGGGLVNWGSEGQITEYDAAGTPVFHAFLGTGDFLTGKLQNYRAFRYNWTGISPETPAVLAEEVVPAGGSSGGSPSSTRSSGIIRLFVSWNGDTETRTWRFVWDEEDADAGTDADVTRQATVPRRGFETAFQLHRPAGVRIASVRAEALGDDGRLLAVSSAVEVQKAQKALAKPETRVSVDVGDKIRGQSTLDVSSEL